jgi:hypothetical protein
MISSQYRCVPLKPINTWIVKGIFCSRAYFRQNYEDFYRFRETQGESAGHDFLRIRAIHLHHK